MYVFYCVLWPKRQRSLCVVTTHAHARARDNIATKAFPLACYAFPLSTTTTTSTIHPHKTAAAKSTEPQINARWLAHILCTTTVSRLTHTKLTRKRAGERMRLWVSVCK